LSVNSLRDASRLPPEARRIIDENNAKLKRLLTSNMKAADPKKSNPVLLSDMTLTFFSGLCIEQESCVGPSRSSKKIDQFMKFLTEAN
jgi:hypothetical protein